MCVYMHIYMCIFMLRYVYCLCVIMHKGTRRLVHTRAHPGIHSHMHTHVSTHTRAVFIYIYIYICIHIYGCLDAHM